MLAVITNTAEVPYVKILDIKINISSEGIATSDLQQSSVRPVHHAIHMLSMTLITPSLSLFIGFTHDTFHLPPFFFY